MINFKVVHGYLRMSSFRGFYFDWNTCSREECQLPALPCPPGQRYRYCLEHVLPYKVFTIDGVKVRKHYIKLDGNRYTLSREYYEDNESFKGYCQICKEDSDCVIQRYGKNEFICAEHINKQNYYTFKDERVRGDMVQLDQGMLYRNICTDHAFHKKYVGITCDLTSDTLFCKKCLSQKHQCLKCERYSEKYYLLKHANGFFCFKCISPYEKYILPNGKSTKGSQIYITNGVGKGCSLFFEVRGMENQCRHCKGYFSNFHVKEEWGGPPGVWESTTTTTCPLCNKRQ
jgi:hypothetical protein